MGESTGIEWCHHTFNPWIGCTKVAPECANCYAEEQMAKRWKKVEWGDKALRSRTATWKDPVKWNKQAEAAGERRRVFCASLADVFENKPELVEWRRELFALIDATPWLDWLLLTKRPENIRRMWPRLICEDRISGCRLSQTDGIICPEFECDAETGIRGLPLRKNVWLGTSCGHSDSLHRVRSLVKCRELSPVLFVSAEPLLQPLDFGPLANSVDWIIVGGESGRDARPCDPDWIRSIVIQCRNAEVPVFVKQMGGNIVTRNDRVESPDDSRSWPDPLVEYDIHGYRENYQGADCRLRTRDAKGGNPAEWPEDLRVREFPQPNLPLTKT